MSRHPNHGKYKALPLIPSETIMDSQEMGQDESSPLSNVFIKPSPSDLYETDVGPSRNRIKNRWGCSERGHSVCFKTLSFHYDMSSEDVDEWAFQLTRRQASLDEPPESLLLRWIHADSLLSAASTRRARDTVASSSLSSSTTARTSFLGSLSYRSSFAPSFHYAAGSAIKGIGNGLIGTLAYLDSKYRERRLRGLLIHHEAIRSRQRNATSRAFHRVVSSILAPGKHLNNLLSDILELGSPRVGDEYERSDLWWLASILDAEQVPMSAYTRMKWLRITMAEALERQDGSLLFEGSQIFLDDFESDAIAAACVTRYFKSIYNGLSTLNLYSQCLLLILLSQTTGSRISEPPLSSWFPRETLWTTIFEFGFFFPRMSSSQRNSLSELNDLLDIAIHVAIRDPSMEFDAHPNEQFSLWGHVCNELRSWLRRHRTVEGWDSERLRGLDTHRGFSEIVRMMRNLHAGRRSSLRAAHLMTPLMEAVHEDLWITAAKEPYFPSDIGENVQASVKSAANCKALSLELAANL